MNLDLIITLLKDSIILSSSIALLIILILLIRKFIGSRYGTWWRSLAWTLILIRLLIPAIPNSIIGLTSFEANEEISLTSNFQVEQINVVNDTSHNEPITSNDKQITDAQATSSDISPSEKSSNSRFVLNLNMIALLTYISGFIISLIFLCKNILIQKIRSSKIYPIQSDVHMQYFTKIKTQLGIKKHISLYVDEEANTPYLYGIIRPKVVLPLDILTDLSFQEIKLVFAHELIHYKRKDVLRLWLLEVVNCIHWYNVILHLCKKYIQQDFELACDEKALQFIGHKKHLLYGQVLATSSKAIPKTFTGVLTAHVANKTKNSLKERLEMIRNYNRKLSTVGGTILTLLLIVLLTACTTKHTSEIPDITIEETNTSKNTSTNTNNSVENLNSDTSLTLEENEQASNTDGSLLQSKYNRYANEIAISYYNQTSDFLPIDENSIIDFGTFEEIHVNDEFRYRMDKETNEIFYISMYPRDYAVLDNRLNESQSIDLVTEFISNASALNQLSLDLSNTTFEYVFDSQDIEYYVFEYQSDTEIIFIKIATDSGNIVEITRGSL